MYKLLCFLFIQTVILNSSASTLLNDTIHLQVLSSSSETLHGTYIVNKSSNYLITTTDENGHCKIPYKTMNANDTIKFSYLGFVSLQLPLRELQKNKQIILTPKTQFLQEVNVKGIRPDILLEKVSRQLKSFRPQHILNYYGNAQYEKITECNSRAVEYRNEFGCFLTSGNVKLKEKWDLNYHFYFIPVYSTRSFNLQSDGKDTLKKQAITGGRSELDYDAGNRKIFHAIRAILLWGPLFSKLDYYDIKPLESDSTNYVFLFTTKKKYYPNNLKIYCRGTLKIDKQTHSLKNIHLDYLDYHFYKLTNQTRPRSPFSTNMEINFAYNDTTGIYIHSCQQITTWKHNSDKTFGGIEKPSRRNPANNHLIEREALLCENYQEIPQNKQKKHLLQEAYISSCNPEGKFDVQVFNLRPKLLNEAIALKELNEYCNIQTQFDHNNNKSYYPVSQISLPIKTNMLNIPQDIFIQTVKNKTLQKFFYQP